MGWSKASCWKWLDPTRQQRPRHPAPQSPPEHPPHTAHPRPCGTQITTLRKHTFGTHIITLRNTSSENSGDVNKKSIRCQRLVIKGTSKWLLSATSVEQCCGSATFWYGSGFAPLTNGSWFGSGSGSCYFRQWPSRRQHKIIFFSKCFCFLLFEAKFT